MRKQDIQDQCPETLEILRKRILHFLKKKLIRDHSTAEDVTQDALIKIIGSIDSFNEECHVATWAMRIARNLALDYHRKTKELPLEIDVEKEEPQGEPFEAKIARLREAVDTLPPKKKVVADLMCAGKSNKEIATALGITVNYAYKKTHEIRRDLAGKL